VRAVTGVGCSEKLITQWRRDRQRGGEKEGQGEGAKKRRGVLALMLCLGLNACVTTTTTFAPPAPEITISPAPSDSPNFSNLKSQISNSPGPRLLRIKLTINAARDLLVKTDDEVNAGQALTNRSHDRRRIAGTPRTTRRRTPAHQLRQRTSRDHQSRSRSRRHHAPS
jgi:hypothetical protein